MPAHNAARYLNDAVRSVQAQTYGNWELLIVNDASTDTTSAIAEKLQSQDPRIKVFTHDQNKGVAKARNFALSRAGGEYIAFLDSDDLWVPEKLEKQVHFMEARNVLVAYSCYQRINESGEKLGIVRPPKSIGYNALLKSNFIGNLTGIYNAEKLGKEYFTDFRHEDYVAWLALVKRAGKAESVNEELGLYRVYDGSTSSNKFKTIGWQWKIYRSSQSLSIFRSCWLMACYAFYATQKRI